MLPAFSVNQTQNYVLFEGKEILAVIFKVSVHAKRKFIIILPKIAIINGISFHEIPFILQYRFNVWPPACYPPLLTLSYPCYYPAIREHYVLSYLRYFCLDPHQLF